MFHLIYTSNETQAFTAEDLRKLLLRARMRNQQKGVTGMLVHRAGCFLQALEGDEDAVNEIYQAIAKDTRHSEINLLRRGRSFGQQRHFGTWSMGFADESGMADVLRGFVSLNEDLDLRRLPEAEAFTLLSTCGQRAVAAG